MSEPGLTPQDVVTLRRAALIVAVPIAVVVLGYYGLRALRRLALEQNMRDAIARAERQVREVRAGKNDVSVYDPLIIPMLSADAACIKNLADVGFVVSDFSDPYYQEIEGDIQQLENIHSIGFYSCSHTDRLLEMVAESPQQAACIEQLWFDVSVLPRDKYDVLLSFPNLRKLHLQYVIPDDALAELQQFLPKVDIHAPWPESKERAYRESQAD